MLTLNQTHHGNALELATQLAPQSINCLVTSPPYFNLRSYNGEASHWPEVAYSPLFGLPHIVIPEMDCQLGREATIEAYIGHLTGVFRALRDKLKDDGVLWVNIADSFSNDNKWGGQSGNLNYTSNNGNYQAIRDDAIKTGLPPKSLCGIPWRFALAMQADGWILRSDTIWHKTNPQPESTQDRPSKAHEYLFLFSKQPRYWYDGVAIKTPIKQASLERSGRGVEGGHKMENGAPGQYSHSLHKPRQNVKFGGNKADGRDASKDNEWNPETHTANRKSVWSLPTAQYRGSHYAVMPSRMAELCILAGCPAEVCGECGTPYRRIVKKTGHKSRRKPAHVPNDNSTQNSSTGWKPANKATSTFEPDCSCNAPSRPGVVLDPFMGSGTVAEAAIKFGRDWVGFDMDEGCIELTNERIHGTQIMMPVEVT